MGDQTKKEAATGVRQEQLSQLPSVDNLLNTEGVFDLIEGFGRDLVLQGIREILEVWRSRLNADKLSVPDVQSLVSELRAWLDMAISPTLRPVINATGVIIHTNLGRAPLSGAALQIANESASGYSNLEYDLSGGKRGSRAIHAQKLLTSMTGAEAALVVNNNAAAVLLMLTVICRGKEVIISRGQLVEIGGGFRLPEVMAQSGATLVEVGATNRTHLYDYENAIGDNTGAILVAHHSNFKIIGFTSEPDLEELAGLAHTNSLPLLYDQGSGALLDTTPYGLGAEPTVVDGLRAGADLVAFSGDKLLGGPQAGIICGRKSLIGSLKSHPLARAVRVDKLCLSALSVTLASFMTGRFEREIPVWQMISQPINVVEERATEWVRRFEDEGLDAQVVDGESTVGGGSLPGSSLPTKMVAISHEHPDDLAARLRANDPPVIGRIAANRLLLDPRTVDHGQDGELIDAVVQCLLDLGIGDSKNSVEHA